MAVTQSGTSVSSGDDRPIRTGGIRRIWLWIAIAVSFAAAATVVLGLEAKHYQPLSMWDYIGGFPGMHRPAGAHTVNSFGGQTGEYFIPHQHWTFAASVSLVNSGSFAVTIEDVSILPPLEYPQSLKPAGPVLYWTSRMTTGNPKLGRPIAGLVLKPGDLHGIYIAVPLRTPKCYIPRAFQVHDSFYVKELFGPFTKWVRIPLMQPLLVNAPAAPVNQPGQDIICSGQ
jgi:hypothetical protein